VKKRNIWIIALIALVSCIISAIGLIDFSNKTFEKLMTAFEFVSFGLIIIYIVWQCSFQGELRRLTNKGFGAWGHFGLTIFTLGIYTTYWHYAAAKRLNQLGAKDRSSLYLPLSIISCVSALVALGFGIHTFSVALNQASLGDYSSVSNLMPLPLSILNVVLSLIPYAILMRLLNDANKLNIPTQAIQPKPKPSEQFSDEEWTPFLLPSLPNPPMTSMQSEYKYKTFKELAEADISIQEKIVELNTLALSGLITEQEKEIAKQRLLDEKKE